MTTWDCCRRPLIISTAVPFLKTSTRWPPVTLVYDAFVRRVGMKAGVVGIAVER